MAYSHALAERVRTAIGSRRDVVEKKMFGGVVFLLRGNMLVGIWRQSLIVRLGSEQAAAALKLDYVREFDVTGRPMKNWIMVDPDGLDTDAELAAWIERATAFVETLPAK
jgi:TfoX/Sxy family transcriptional regulator of competence genes